MSVAIIVTIMTRVPGGLVSITETSASLTESTKPGKVNGKTAPPLHGAETTQNLCCVQISLPDHLPLSRFSVYPTFSPYLSLSLSPPLPWYVSFSGLFSPTTLEKTLSLFLSHFPNCSVLRRFRRQEYCTAIQVIHNFTETSFEREPQENFARDGVGRLGVFPNV